MSALVPQKRPDRNGKLVTRHVKDGTATAAKATLPPPAVLASISRQDFINDDIIRDALFLHMEEEEADGYFAFLMRKPQVVQSSLAKALSNVASDADSVNAALAVCEEMSDPTAIVLALNDLDFIVDMARAPYGTVQSHEGTSKAYNGVLMVLNQAYGEHFQRGALNPETVDLDTYGPFLRAATITKALGLDSRAPTSLDRHKQIEHVSEHVSTFASYYPSLIRITQETNKSALPMNSHIMLDVCAVLDEYPGSEEVLVSYVNERQRFDMEEFKTVLNAPSRSLSSGTL